MAVRAEKEVKNYFEEDEDSRILRRSRIMLIKSSSAVDLEDPHCRSVDITNFFGNFLLDRKSCVSGMDLQGIMQSQDNPMQLVNLLKMDMRKLRNYVENFKTKGNIMLDIFNSISGRLGNTYDACLRDYMDLKTKLLVLTCSIDQRRNDLQEELERVEEDNQAMSEEIVKLNALEGLFKDILVKLDPVIELIAINEKKIQKDFNSKFITEKIFGYLCQVVTDKYNTFTTNYYNVHKTLLYNQNLAPIIKKSTSLLIDEFKICSMMRIFQKIFDNYIVEQIADLSEDLTKGVKEVNEILIELIPKANNIIKDNLLSGFEELDISFVELQKKECCLNGLIKQNLLKFMKKKVEMEKSHFMIEQDFIDFFDIYRIIYSKDNNIVLSCLKCQLLVKESLTNNTAYRNALLILDLTGGVTVIQNYTSNDDDKNLTMMKYFDREIGEVKKSIRFFRYCLDCSLTLDAEQDLIKIDFSIDDGIVSQHLKKVAITLKVTNLERTMTFMKLFKAMKLSRTPQNVGDQV